MADPVNARKGYKCSLTRLGEKIAKLDKNNSKRESYNVLVNSVLELKIKFESNHNEVMASSTTQGELDKANNDQSDVLEKILDYQLELAEIETAIIERERPNEEKREEARLKAEYAARAAHPVVTTTPAQRVKLPELKLPSFNGQFEDWLPFRDRYLQAVHNRTDLSGAQKLQYLLSSLEGSAASILEYVTLNDANYAPAWEALTNKFEHKREIVLKHLQRILDQPQVQSRASSKLQSLLSTTTNAISAVKSLGEPVEHWDSMIIAVIIRKIDQTSRLRFLQSLPNKNMPTWKTLADFLDKEIMDLSSFNEKLEPTQASHSTLSRLEHNEAVKQTSKSSVKLEKKVVCGICSEDHLNFKCQQLTSAPAAERKRLVENAKLCTNCLKPGHFWKKCTATGVCKECKGKHHTYLHGSYASKASADKVNSTLATTTDIAEIKFKPTAVVGIKDSKGHAMNCRVLIDNCSDESFISSSLVNKLGLKTKKLRNPQKITAIQSTEVTTVQEYVQVELQSKHYSDITIDVSALVIKTIGGPYPSQLMERHSWKHLPTAGLADESFNMPSKVDILLSSDIYYDIIRSAIIRGEKHQPVAQESALGWLVGGGRSNPRTTTTRCNLTTCSLEEDMQKFWEIEKLESSERLRTKEEEACEKHYLETTTQLNNGTYQVQLPFKINIENLGNSKCQAFKRFKANEARLLRVPERHERYNEAMEQLIQDGHIEIVPPEQEKVIDNESFYLPHHAVIKESSTTTKVRIVFDASAKTSSGQSLNDQLMVGPVIQRDLLSILISWRWWLIPISADVQQMYLFIEMHPKDRDFLRLYHRKNPQDPIKCYRKKKVTFGTACAPFQAVRTLYKLAQEYGPVYPAAAEVVKRDFYVDDCLTGAQTIKDALALQQQLLQLMKAGQFTLRKWSSSSQEVLQAVPEELREQAIPLSLDTDDTIKALGLIWHPASDEFRFQVREPE